MTDFPHVIPGKEHFHDVEPEFDARKPCATQIGEGRLRQQALLARPHRCGRPPPIFRTSGLHFDENEAFAVPEDQVDLPFPIPVIGNQEFATQCLQMAPGGFFAEASPMEVERFGAPAPEHASKYFTELQPGNNSGSGRRNGAKLLR